MPPNFVDIENEFAEIGWEAEHLSICLGRIDPVNPIADLQERWETTQICASAAEKIYTGCERVMATLASLVDQSPVIHDDAWHAALLRRMAHPFPGVRAAVISDECYALLDRLRAFRHRERNTYGINLDFDTVVARGREAVVGLSQFRDEVTAFLTGIITSSTK